MLVARKCAVVECEKPVVAKDLCETHYKRWKRHGHTDATRASDWGCRERHPLYQPWNWLMRRNARLVGSRWRDLWAFVADIGDTRPSVRHKLRRLDKTKLFGPGNVYWVEPAVSTRSPDEKVQRRLYAKGWRDANQRKAQNSQLRRYYGIGVEDYDLMMSAQAGVCAICQMAEASVDPKTKKVRRLAVDHCHTTHKVRGLLCSGCNGALGSFKDDLTTLRKAVAYLERHLE